MVETGLHCIGVAAPIQLHNKGHMNLENNQGTIQSVPASHINSLWVQPQHTQCWICLYANDQLFL